MSTIHKISQVLHEICNNLLNVYFSSIVRHSPSHGKWENAGPLLGIRVDLVRDHIGLDNVQTDLVKDEVVLVHD